MSRGRRESGRSHVIFPQGIRPLVHEIRAVHACICLKTLILNRFECFFVPRGSLRLSPSVHSQKEGIFEGEKERVADAGAQEFIADSQGRGGDKTI